MNVAILDCDVEEPNVNLFLRARIEKTELFGVLVPDIDKAQCTGCGACERTCAFSAIVVVQDTPLLFPDMCHSCGGCYHTCPEGAIREIEKPTGIIESGTNDGILFAGGRLNIGEAQSPPLIREVKRRHTDCQIRIIDSPPGTSCPAVEAMKDSDYVVLVTEPTPFGIHDLILAAGAVRAQGIPFGVVVNRADIGNGSLMEQCRLRGYDIIASIPHSRDIAESYSRGDCATIVLERHREEIEKIAEQAECHHTRRVRA
jgi:MinD superfamily P-loop ATPase